MWYLYGIIHGSEELNFGKIGFTDPYGKQTPVKTVPFEDIALVVSELDDWELDEKDKKALMNKLLSHQKTLEEIMKKGLVIPIKFGTVVSGREDIDTILGRSYRAFSRTLADMEGKFEVNLTASWDVPTQLKKIAESDDEIKALKREAQEKKSQELIMKVGMKLEDKLELRRQRTASKILSSLDSWGENRVDHERLENEMILNTSFLVSKDREDDFLKSIHGLDEKFGGEFNFKCLMPLPPHSFRTVMVQKIHPERLRKAMNLFDVNKDTTLDTLKEKGRELIHRYHPDAGQGENDNDKISQIYQSLDLLKALYEMMDRPFDDIDTEHCYLTKIVAYSV